MSAHPRTSAPSALWLLIRVNALQSWRRLLSIRRQSRLLTGIIGIFVLGYLVLSFELFHHGLQFIAKFPGLGAALTDRLLYVLFAFLFALLLLSNLIICCRCPFPTRPFFAGNSLNPPCWRPGPFCF